MLRQVLIVQQAFRVAIDEPRFNFDAPTPQTLDVKFPPSPSRFAFSLQDRRYAPISMPKRLFKSTSGCRIAAISESGNQSPAFKVSVHHDHKPSKGVI
jgi:hypothetical protein